MTLQSYSWAYMWRKTWSERIHTPQCSRQQFTIGNTCVCTCVRAHACARVYVRLRVRTCVCVRLVTQSCPTLCNHMDCRPPGSFVHGDLQARILEWVTMPSCRGPSQPWYLAQVSRTAGRFFTIWATTEAPAKTWNKRPNQKVGQRIKQTFLQRRHTDG